MQPDIPLLQQTILFSGIEAEELRHLLTCLGGSVRRYGRVKTKFRCEPD